MTNFGDIPAPYDHMEAARIVVLPVPYDQTSTWLKGADKGPSAIIAASAHMELYDIETDMEVYRMGIATVEPVEEDSSPELMVEAVRDAVIEYIGQEKFVVMLGGEHSVSIGAIQACARKFPQMTVLQLDAHSDLRPDYEGSPYNHACVMARAQDAAHIVQVGIRSMDAAEKKFVRPDRMFYAEQIRRQPNWMDQVVHKLTDQVYLTIDLDVFDPSIMPSTGTPEPGGLLWDETLELLRRVFSEKQVVGMDVVELCPSKHNKAPDFLAAKLIYKLLSYKFRGTNE